MRVKFGSTEAMKTEVKNDQHIKTEVPDLSLLDHNPVKVTLFLDDAPVEGDMWFEYDPPGPDPLISGLNPETAQAGTEFSMEIVGANFMTPNGRVPNQILLSGPVAVFWGTIISNSATDTSFTAEFYLPPATMPGEYSILVGFSDGASTEAQGFQVIP